MKKIAIVGCGWLGQPLAEQLLNKGVEVMGTTRSAEKMQQLEARGIRSFLLDLEVAQSSKLSSEFSAIDCLFLNIPPRIRGAKDIDQASRAFLSQMELLLQQIDFDQVHLVVASSTSVYPDLNIKMDESFGAVGSPSGIAGETLRVFERMCLDYAGFDTTIVRYGGLYGAGRHPVKYFAGKKDLDGGMQRVNMVSLQKCLK
jgi:nucleoside-diphosphate-sugar epimerase